MPVEIVVLGAGVLGLTTAYQLSQDDRYAVTVISKCLPTDPHLDYTSQYAGANWRSVCANDDYKMIALEEVTLRYFREFSKIHPELVNQCMSYDIFDPREPDANDRRKVRTTDINGGEVPWFAKMCSKFHILDRAKLPKGADFGIGFETVTINAPEYVKWLYQECMQNGVHFDIREIKSFSEVNDKFRHIINCTGLGSIALCDDEELYPTRGQTVLVKNTTNLLDTWSRVGQNHLSYLIPRPGDGGLIIGGCQQPGVWNYEVDENLADTMLEWARTLYPDLFHNDHKFEVIKHNVGLRPSRKTGIRLDTEILDERYIIHGYGIGGWGFQSSWGVGMNLVERLGIVLAAAQEKTPIEFDHASALAKVKKAQNLWNTKDAQEVAKAYTQDSIWRNRDSFLHGRAEIKAFLDAKWTKEHNYRLRKELFSFQGNRIAVEFYYEYSETKSEDSQWHRCYGIEHWVFASDGKMQSRQMSGNEVRISKDDRWFRNDNVDTVVLPRGHGSI